jgi:hypothetical protein
LEHRGSIITSISLGPRFESSYSCSYLERQKG